DRAAGGGPEPLTSSRGPRSLTRASLYPGAGESLDLSWPDVTWVRRRRRTAALGKHGRAKASAADHRRKVSVRARPASWGTISMLYPRETRWCQSCPPPRSLRV